VTDAEREQQRASLEQRIAEAELTPYQAMVVRNVARWENVTAALDWIERLGEVATDER
jgi:phosphoketolase